ncbi:hypothetical protein [Rhodococcus qingshengii]|uniref:hypothetical protein n=1 Tax=Rhodococcus qingshengii TaxID=334542 RepID=UPI001ADFF6DA|nr:hypothetical protein [Rhodococcus qingshengii]MCQ4148673.1 hypothetical protein [Rhodococcus qingshengii]
MPGAPRKSAPRKSAPRKAQPKVAEPAVVAEEVIDEVDDDSFDLLTVLETDDLPPLPVVLRGVKAQIRRSYSGDEAVKFTEYMRHKQVDEALTLMAGEEQGKAISVALTAFSIEQGLKLFNQIAKMSTLTVGEALAFFPASYRGMDGTPLSQGVSAITDEMSDKS